MAIARLGFRLAKTLGPNEPIIGMIEYGGDIFVATDARVFKLRGGEKFIPLPFEIAAEAERGKK